MQGDSCYALLNWITIKDLLQPSAGSPICAPGEDAAIAHISHISCCFNDKVLRIKAAVESKRGGVSQNQPILTGTIIA